MPINSRFMDADAIHRRIEGCPLASRPPAEDESACRTCPYNLGYPGTPRMGCAVATPVDVLRRALGVIEAKAPDLATELRALRALDRVLPGEANDATALRWRELAEAGAGRVGEDDPDVLEIFALAARFARAALELGEPVEVLR